MLTRRSLIQGGLAAAGVLALGVSAPMAQASGDPAVAQVRGLYDAYQAALKDGAGTVQTRYGAVEAAMAKAFDFPAMLRTAVGPRWRDIPEAKQPVLIEAFSRYFTATYATRLSSAAGGKFEVQPKSEARTGGTKLVRTKVTDAQGGDAPVDFILSDQNRITDVLLQGTVSEVATLRGNLAAPLKSGGADGLLAFLKQQADGMLAAK